MTICPFCKKAVVNAGAGPCPSCGKVDPNRKAAPPPAPAASGGGDWDDLEIQRGAGTAAPTGPSSYSGGSMGGFGDDDDNGPGISLELDTPVRSVPPQQPPMAPPGSMPARSAGGSGGYPAYQDAMPQPMPARSKPGSDPAMHAQQSSPNMAPAPSSPQVGAQQPQMSPPPVVAALPPPGPADPAAMIARYPAPPAKVWETPIYALRVLWRQYELRQDIASLKKRRSPDVALYERALKLHDATNLLIGLVITFAALTIATFLFFLPVIIRFVRDPD